MENKIINCNGIEISNNKRISLIAGPCQLESEQHAMDMAGKIKEIADKFKIGFIYKTSFDKANRTSIKGKRGAGLEKSLPVFDKIKKDVHWLDVKFGEILIFNQCLPHGNIVNKTVIDSIKGY